MLFFLVLVEEEVAVALIELTPVPANKDMKMWSNPNVSHFDKHAVSSLFSWRNKSYLLMSHIDLYMAHIR